MCEFCRGEVTETPTVADVPGMDVEMSIDTCIDVRTGELVSYLVIENVRTYDEARLKVLYCPLCGRKIGDGS